MNDKTGGRWRGARRAGALAAVAAAALVMAGCGVVHVNFGGGGSASPAASAPTYAQELALAQCMRGHGVPAFPDPTASGGYRLTSNGSIEGSGGSAVNVNSSQAQAAYGACRHLLSGAPSISQLEQDVQQAQQRQEQELPALLKFSQCVRGHGVPDFPDPGDSQSPPPGNGAPINPNSPQVQAAVKACQHLLPAGAHVSISAHESTSGS